MKDINAEVLELDKYILREAHNGNVVPAIRKLRDKGFGLWESKRAVDKYLRKRNELFLAYLNREE